MTRYAMLEGGVKTKGRLKDLPNEPWDIQCNWDIPTVGFIQIGPFYFKARTGSLKAKLLLLLKRMLG